MNNNFQYLAHVEDSNQGIIAEESVAQIYTLMTIFVVIVVAILLFVFKKILEKIPKTKRFLSKKKEQLLARLILIFSVTGFVGAGIDIWWHRAVGRDHLFEPPHIIIYVSAIIVVICGLYAWYLSRENSWKKIAMAMALVPVSAPIDNFWHILFGVEDLSRAILLSWSPPHVLLTVSMIFVFAFLIPVFKREKRVLIRKVLIDISLVGILNAVMFLLWPFHPTEGFGQVIGFWGAGILAIPLVAIPIIAQNKNRGLIDATRISAISLLLFLISYGQETATDVIIAAHDRAPIWLVVFSVLIPGILLDATKGKLQNWIRGGLAGFIWSGFIFGIFTWFVSPEFSYNTTQVLIALGTAMVGGIVGSFLAQKFFKN